MERCCGKCKYVVLTGEQTMAICSFAVPVWVKDRASLNERVVVTIGGTDCPCFERKEA